MKYFIFFIVFLTVVSCNVEQVNNKMEPLTEGKPSINDPSVFGSFPDQPFLFAVPTTGQSPFTWNAENLPPGLEIDAKTGIISGIANAPGDYQVKVTAENKLGKTEKIISVKIGDQLALTPPMGWNSWNPLGANVNEKAVMETADAMVNSGLRDVGFAYIVIDGTWEGGRDSITGLLYPDPLRFPSGIKVLADYIHSRGLKFGIYSDAGNLTCDSLPGSFGYEEKDAKLFAEWGVDYLKYDYCYCTDFVSSNNDYKMAIARYKAMGDALKSTGRPIVYSICEWGPRSPWLWGKEVGGHLWRTTYDVHDIWDTPNNKISPIGVLAAIDGEVDLERFSGPGAWNDPDMLIVGLKNKGFIKGGGCTDIQYQTQMSMWCMLSAPLMLGCDLRNMDEMTKKILLNKDIIAIDQDPLGQQAIRVFRKDGLEAWKKPLSGNRVAIAFLNRNSSVKSFTAELKDVEMEMETQYNIYDVWNHSKLHVTKGTFPLILEGSECKVFIFSSLKPE